MKINYLKRYFIGIAMTAFLALLAGNAFGLNATSKNASRDVQNGTGDDIGKYANNFLVVSPYWQSEGAASYTFIAVSHSSLSGMASQIGVKINAITSTGSAYATAATFTVASGDTQRVFIVPTNHATINSTAITDTDASFIAGTTDFTYGHIRVNPVAKEPQQMIGGVYLLGTGAYADGQGFRDTTMLTYWGSVIVEANTTGFAMEFIGDMNDSVALAKHWGNVNTGHVHGDVVYSSGVNLQ